MKQGMLLLFVSVLVLSFQNCNRQKFTTTEFESTMSSTNLPGPTGLPDSTVLVGGIAIEHNAAFTNKTNVSIQVSSDGAKQMYLTNDPTCASGGAWVPYQSESSWVLPEKNKSTSVYAKFRSANDQASSECFGDSIIHDDIPPIITQQGQLPKVTKQADLLLEWSVEDQGSGIKSQTCSWLQQSCDRSVTFTATTEGAIVNSVIATDKAGNPSEPLNLNWTYDKTPPVIQFQVQPATLTRDKNAQISVSALNEISTNLQYQCTVDLPLPKESDFKACEKTLQLSGLSDGPHEIFYRAMDEAGNISLPISHKWSIQNNAPNIEFTKTPDKLTSQSGQFSFKGTDQFGVALTQFKCRLNGGELINPCPSGFIPTVLNQGSNSFELIGVDSSGKESGVLKYPWSYDTVSPQIKWIQHPSEFTKNLSEIVEIEANELQGLAKIIFKLDGEIISESLDKKINLLALKEGYHLLEVAAFDLVNNPSNVLSFPFYSDFTAPVLQLGAIAPFSRSVNLSIPFTVSDTLNVAANSVSVFYDLNDKNDFKQITSPLNLQNLAEGAPTVKFYAVDKAGNRSDIQNRQSTIDLSGPQITFVNEPSSVKVGASVSAQFLVEDSSSGLDTVSCELTVNAVARSYTPCLANGSLNLSNLALGSYKFSVSAMDKVGNQSEKSISWTVAQSFTKMTHSFEVTAVQNNDVDILFVIDNSGSMYQEQQRISAAFNNFLGNLGTINYRIGIITTDIVNTSQSGKLQPIKLQPIKKTTNILDYTTIPFIQPTTANGQIIFERALAAQGTSGSRNEKGLTAIDLFAQKALTTSTSTSANEYKFYRPQAVFATIILSDSDETQYTTSFPTATEFLTKLKTRLGVNKTYIHHSVISLPGDTACKDPSENIYGSTYFDLSNLTGGISASICSADYGQKLKEFSTLIVNKVSEQTLECEPADANKDGTPDVEVKFSKDNGVTWTAVTQFNLIKNKLSFSTPLDSAGKYKAEFSCIEQ